MTSQMATRGFEIGEKPSLSRLLLENAAGASLSLLPAEWRAWWEEEPLDAVLSGVIEAVLGSIFFLRFLVIGIDAELNGLNHEALTAIGTRNGDAGIMALGPVILVALLFKPVALISLIVGFEGYVRAASAMISREVLPSFFFWVPARLIRLRKRTPARVKRTSL